jgi:hypothetical protein
MFITVFTKAHDRSYSEPDKSNLHSSSVCLRSGVLCDGTRRNAVPEVMERAVTEVTERAVTEVTERAVTPLQK